MKKKKFTIILLFIFMLIVGILYFNIGSDYYWHIKVGEYIVKMKELPKTCIYSWFANENNLMFTLHEWLYQIIIYGFYKISSIYGTILYIITFLTILIAFIYKTTIKKLLKKNLNFIIPFLLISTINLIPFIQPRPHIISWILIAITTYLSYDLYENNSKKIYFLPFVSLIWGNVHGGSSSLAYIIPLIFTILGLFNFNKCGIVNKRLSKEKLFTYTIIIILNILSLLINPYGINMILYPYINMFDSTMKHAINEWHPTNIKTITGLMGYTLIFYNLYIYYQSKGKIKLIDLSLFIIFTYLATSSSRFIPLFVIISFYTTINYINDNNQDIKNNIIIIISTIICLIIPFQLTKIKSELTNTILEQELILTIKEFKPKRLYNDYNIGGELIYHDIDVFIDGRADAYSKNNLKDSYSLSMGDGTDTKELLNKYNFDLLITENDCFLDKFLNEDNDYELVIEGKNYSIYKPKQEYN